MHDQAFAILEFDALRSLVGRNAQTDAGRARVAAIAPIDDHRELQRALDAVRECIELRKRGVRWSFDGVADPTDSLSRLRIEGAALDPLALLDVAQLCERAMDARGAIHAERETCPALFANVAALPRELDNLKALIEKKILPGGELDDRASPELARIRRELGRLRTRITRSLESLMRRTSDAIQDELVTVRNDRFVIPVRADHRARINGVAHGVSSSGATVFIEPLESIEANNELQSLREDEEREIANVLFELSEKLRRELPGIEQAAIAIAELDFIGAKAAFAEKFACVVPHVSEPGAGRGPRTGSPRGVVVATGSQSQVERYGPLAIARGSDTNAILEFVDARHPLLEESLRVTGGEVVPVSFSLNAEKSVMVISGANAGGKTVVLKTAGLLSLMALSGLPAPARQARVPLYRSVLADIGDHQSLAANLSTFTSHVANIASMIEFCEMPALVLLDEVGTGTDPEEGSALGVAVVDHFKRRGAQVLATTHYAGLKMFAANEPGVQNASVEFDEKTLRPTYRLLVGLAGSSSGLEIARRFGMPREIIESANAQVKETSRDATEYLRRIKLEAEDAKNLRSALEEERAAVAEKFAALEKLAQKYERERRLEFESELAKMIGEFEKRGRELISRIEDRAGQVKVEREAQKRAAELKREAQRAAREMKESSKRITQGLAAQGQEEGLPPQLRGVRVVCDGKVVNDPRAAKDIEVGREAETFLISSLGTDDSGRGARTPSESHTLNVGDRVRLRTFGSIGIIDRIKEDEAEVRVGSLRVREKLENLELVKDEPGSSPTPGSPSGQPAWGGAVKQGSESDKARAALRRQAQTTEVHLHSKRPVNESSANAELNLIGRTTDEAVEITDKFLDEAFLSGLSEVRIIHGHGTGALRRAISELLTDHPHVARFAAAPQDHGGSGATVVELKQ